MGRRELLGDLARLAYETIKELMVEAAGDDKARPGVVAVPQTFGSVLNVHPHAHCLASRGVWNEKGQWIPPTSVFARLWSALATLSHAFFDSDILDNLTSVSCTASH